MIKDLVKLKKTVHDMMSNCKESNTKVSIDRRMTVPDSVFDQAENRNIVVNQYMGDININIMHHTSEMLLQIDKMLVKSEKDKLYGQVSDLTIEALEPVVMRMFSQGVNVKDIIWDIKRIIAAIATKNTSTKQEAADLAGVVRGWFNHVENKREKEE
jgi:hypothetical protein